MMKKLLLALLAAFPLCGHAQLAQEDFEDGWAPVPATASSASSDWLILDNGIGTSLNWILAEHSATTPSHEGIEGTHAAFLEPENVADGSPAADYLLTPEFILPGNGALKFWSRLTFANDQGSVYKVMIVPEGSDPSIPANFVFIEEWSETQINPNQVEYNEVTVFLPSDYNGTTVRIAFVMVGDDADGWLIDNVAVAEACAAPSQIAIYNISPTGADVGWMENGSATEWIIEVVPAGTPPTGIGVLATTNPYALTGLDLSTAGFDIYVTAVCPDGGLSNIAGPCYFPPSMMNVISGTLSYDADGDDDCDEGATVTAMPIEVAINGEPAYTLYSNAEGHYALYGFPNGTSEISLQVTTSAAFPEIAAMTQEVTFADGMSMAEINICLPDPEPVSDLSVTLVPTTLAMPGFSATYKAIITNQGTLPTTNVELAVSFDDDRLDFENADVPNNVSGNTVSFTIGTIAPFSTEYRDIVFAVLPPEVNIGGETLEFEAVLTQAEIDVTPEDNTNVLEHIIVNSYDPNDIRVHEGPFITEEQANDYLTYTIRFQNTGTASAVNIRLENTLDDLLDWDTFQPLASSHEYTIMRTGNHLEFRYDNIFLPDENTNELESHGYVTYKIKPKEGLEIGEVIYNSAGIYFDFNTVILTNVASTQIEPPAGIAYSEKILATLYPNPVNEILVIDTQGKMIESVRVFDLNSRECSVILSGNSISMQQLSAGTYFVRVTTPQGSQTFKIVKL